MLRRYFVFVYPLAVATAAGLTYLHFQQAAQAQAAKAEAEQVAFTQVQPAVQPPVAPAQPPAKKKTANGKVKPKRPTSRDEIRTPYLRTLYDQLEVAEGATDDDKKSLRESLYAADAELSDSMGFRALYRIREANRPRPAYRVEHRAPFVPVPRTDPSPLTPWARKPQPKAEFVDPAKAANPATPPAPDGAGGVFRN